MFFRKFLIVVPAFVLGGCGVAVPDIKEAYEANIPQSSPEDPGLPGAAKLEFEIKKTVFCELRDAVRAARAVKWSVGQPGKEKSSQNGFLPLNWGAQVSLSLQVDESSALNPGVVLNTPLPNGLTGFGGASPASSFSQMFGLGIGGTLSSAATRNDKLDSYWTIEYLNRPISRFSVCRSENDPILQKYGPTVSSPFLLNSELGLREWLIGSLFTSNSIFSVGKASELQDAPSGFHPDTMTIEIKFVVLSSGNITPSWRLVRVSANTGTTPFFGLGRMRTHDLIITIGPPKSETTQTHLASQIGNAVSNANRASMALQ